MDLAAPSFQCCGPGAFLCRPFVSFLFFLPQASSRQDKLLLQQMTYINVNEHLMCT